MWKKYQDKRAATTQETLRLKKDKLKPNTPEAKKIKEQTGESVSKNISLFEMLKRPKVLHSHLPQGETLAPNAVDEIEASVKYEGYIKRQKIDIERLQRNENTPIPQHIDYEKVVGLSNEVKQKLSEARPGSLARASRLPGVTPAAISLLMIYLKKERQAVG